MVLEAPADLVARERALEGLGFGDLTVEERQALPPLLVVGAADGFGESLAGLWRLLGAGVPVKVLLLDDAVPGTAGDVVLRALAQRNAFVVSASIAHGEHLFREIGAALAFDGPALVRIHAPSPRRHGCATDEAPCRARLAVDARVRPLVRYDPAAEGAFGKRLSLEGNPQPAEAWTSDPEGTVWTPERWAAGETRFQTVCELPPDRRDSQTPLVHGPNGGGLAGGGIFSDECAGVWATLQELAGVKTPFTAEVRAEIEASLRDAHRAEIDALRSEYEQRSERERTEQQATTVARLRERLLQLAGYQQGRR